MRKVVDFCKKEIVLVAAFVLAVISCFFVKPSLAYIDYIDWRVLGILLALMIIMEGLKENGLFASIGNALLKKTKKVWQLCAVLVFLCFFLGMFITNDVALITFVPFAIYVLKQSHKEELAAFIIVLQTLAANLGSMLTPIGNPQNLYLYQLGGYTMGEFLKVMLPVTVASGVMLILCLFFIPGKMQKLEQENISRNNKDFTKKEKRNIGVYLVLFVLALSVVLRLIPYYIVLGIVVLLVLILERKILKQVDYCLLLTFICFFIFIGNLGNLPVFKETLEGLVTGRELLAGVISSQVVSNVPASLLLSSFTTDYNALLTGVNLGGLGTLIASMASLISYKQFANTYNTEKGKYFRLFTGLSLLFLAVLLVLAKIQGYSL
ncbi:MAG: anion permease [Agathobacter sp.]|nr:anion permease [Agathobacter sp.]